MRGDHQGHSHISPSHHHHFQHHHVVAVPYPAQGHINPTLHLCLQLVKRGFVVTFVNTQHIHDRILQNKPLDKYLQAHAIHLVSLPGGVPPELHGYKATAQDCFAATKQLQLPLEELLSQQDLIPPFDLILCDALLGWAQHSADKFGVPRVAFWSGSPATCSFLLHCADLVGHGEKLSITREEEENAYLISGIPGLPPHLMNDLPHVCDEKGACTSFMRELVLVNFELLPKALCLLLNTFTELQEEVLQALSLRVPTYTIGPLVPDHFLSERKGSTDMGEKLVELQRPSLYLENYDCLDWLDKQTASSVLYISFGSVSVRSSKQMMELAMGLAASQVPFLWVCRPSIPDTPTCPDDSSGTRSPYDPKEDLQDIIQGCVEKGQGLVVPWAPQLQVLSHPSVGGFMTHCGWNSIMESVALGVPMLCWADSGERRSNQRFVVEFWKCGMQVVQTNVPIPLFSPLQEELVGREEVERTLRAFMVEGEGDVASIRARAAFFKERAKFALLQSSKHLDHIFCN